MKELRRALVLVALGAVLGGCAVQHLRPATHRHPRASSARVHEPGPPPRAPAHGYRHKQHGGVELVFDAKIGVYVVIGHSGHYFRDGYYLRLVDGVWQISAALDRGWAVVPSDRIPKGLRGKHGKKKLHGIPARHRH
ncbi:MAG: hypothetical protein V3V67_11255 [Myxococcota bacterium]